MSDPLFANLLRGVIQCLDKRAKTISRDGYVVLRCWADKWQLAVYGIGRPAEFEGPEPQPLIDQADAFIVEHEPDTVARTLGLDLLRETAEAAE